MATGAQVGRYMIWWSVMTTLLAAMTYVLMNFQTVMNSLILAVGPQNGPLSLSDVTGFIQFAYFLVLVIWVIVTYGLYQALSRRNEYESEW